MEITEKLLIELQNRLKVGSRRGVHLNAIPARSRYKFDLTRLSHIDENLPTNFINALLTELPLKFKISWKDNVPDLNSLFEDDQTQLVKITKSFENLINQTDAIESEKGINTFGFGFPILVRRDQSDNKLTVAPILIWSLRIRRTKEFNTWEILRTEDDPIYINEVLINHLQNDSKIEINQISTDFLDDGLIDKSELLDICVNIIESINSSIPDDLRETFEKKLNQIKSIPEKKHYEKLPLTSNNSFIDFGGLFSIFEVQKQNIIHDYSNLLELKGATIDLEDMEEHTFQPISSVETDPSQQGILHSLKASRNILIQGPPGTGKSQSLTAILVNALENQKKTIVVCEKRTALEVLHNAINEKGLNYQCVLLKDIVKDRRVAVDSVRDRVDNSSYRRYRYTHSKETLDNIIEKSRNLIDSINKKHKKLGANLVGNKNWTHIVGSLLSELKDNSEEYNLDLVKGTFSYESSELNQLLELIRKGQNLYDEFKPHLNLSFINSAKLVGDNPFIIEQQIKEDFSIYKKELKIILDDISSYEVEYYKIRNEQFKLQKTSISDVENSILNILTKHKTNNDFFDEEKTNGFLFKTISIFSKEKKTTLTDQQTINTLFEDYSLKTNNSKDFESINFSKAIKENQDVLKNYKLITERIDKEFQSKIENEYKFLNLLKSAEKEFDTELLQTIKTNFSNLKTKIENQNWTNKEVNGDSHNVLSSQIETLLNSKEQFFANEDDLFSIEFKWFQFYNSLSADNKLIIDQLKEKTNWRKTFLIFYLNSMLVNSANTDLPTNDNDHIELGKSLSELEKEQIKYIREYWFSKQIDATRDFDNKNPNLAVENLYNKRAGKRHKRLSLREIIKLDMDLFTTFFPIILTTPDVASNLFKGKNQYFDIVMFDEASQLKLEDNLPALLKGKQIIIAGDEHQMPPSNYFSKVFDGLIDDEDEFEDEIDKIKNDISNSLSDCESLLDFASELGFEKKHLDFHYRSRHPYLIDYSNYAFYNQRLKPLPNSFDYIPINYVPVNGTYSDTSNDAEAETILSIIDNNISRLPNGEYPTVGVATFNINQRNLILGKINERRKFEKYRDFNDKIVELEENGFFVKNLENIQGDERDVIILSTTYGINKDGKFAQRFGSINHQKGYKLLNVIVTRAKYKVYVCSSIPEDVFLNYKEHLINEGSNNRRGALYAYLAYSKAVSEQDNEARISVLNTLAENSTKSTTIDNLNEDLESPFEEEVYEALTEHFDEKNIIPQLQFAGFRIDMVYDTKHIGLPKIAIECDGASYHSSQEAYLHDSHRQKILEGHGFVFHRIWSTNWWRNPQKETKKLVAFIRSIENSSPSIFEDKSKTGLAFTDNITIIENELSKVTQHLKMDLKETIEAVTKKEEIQTTLFKETITVNSKVKVKYLNINKDLKVHIVDQIASKVQKSNGVQKINIKTPLGVALNGKSVGDTVKIGGLDKYVRILEIIN
ncbi:AAA domain-containing protein [Lacinutrix sp. MEBiC02595]